MRLYDDLQMSVIAVVRYPLRSFMLLLAISIGVAAVLVLTSLGEGARRYISGEFQSLGTHLLIVSPGKSEVGGAGGIAGAMGGTVRDLTLADAEAIARSPYIRHIAPLMPGSANLNYGGIERAADVLGTNHSMAEIRDFEIQRGRFLPVVDLEVAQPVGVIGATLASELFRNESPLGKWVRLGEYRLRVIGVMSPAGQVGIINVDEAVFMPIAFAMQVFNSNSINRMLVEARDQESMPLASADIVATVKSRHAGNDDVTITTQDALLATFDAIFLAVTAVLGGIAAVSLVVAGTLIMNVMLVAVSQRTEEIGLFKALGATRSHIMRLFLLEAALMSVAGAFAGTVFGQLGISVLRRLYPIVDFHAPQWAVAAAVITAVVSGLLFGIMPARRAANLDPIEALSGR